MPKEEKNELTLPGISKVSDWKKPAKNKKVAGVLTFPSGLSARVRALGMQHFITQGLLPSSLVGIVTDRLKSGEVKPDDSETEAQLMQDILDDPKKLADMVSMVDMITVESFLEPKVYPIPADEEDRDDDFLYVDELDFEDKMFLFQWTVGGTSDLDKFRADTEQSLATVSGSKNVRRPAKSVSRARSRKR